MTETSQRSVVKSVTWQVMGLGVMTLVTWLVTGSLSQGSAVALIGMAIGFVTYVLHERVWTTIEWGRLPDRPVNNWRVADQPPATSASAGRQGCKGRHSGNETAQMLPPPAG